MKRDWDLIRNILHKIEDLKDLDDFLVFSKEKGMTEVNIDGYDQDLLSYHLVLLIDAGFIRGETQGNEINDIYGLSWKGHEYAEKLRNNTRWEKIKKDIQDKGLDLGTDTIMDLLRSAIKKSIEGDDT